MWWSARARRLNDALSFLQSEAGLIGALPVAE